MKKTDRFIVNESMSIRDVVIHMNNKQIQIVICKNKSYRKILGIFNEGDFRRLIFKGYNIDDPIGNYINKNFQYVTKESSDADIINIFKKYKIDFLPVLNTNNLVNVLYRNNFKIVKTKNTKKNKSNTQKKCKSKETNKTKNKTKITKVQKRKTQQQNKNHRKQRNIQQNTRKNKQKQNKTVTRIVVFSFVFSFLYP